jgi:hypothetical protein
MESGAAEEGHGALNVPEEPLGQKKHRAGVAAGDQNGQRQGAKGQRKRRRRRRRGGGEEVEEEGNALIAAGEEFRLSMRSVREGYLASGVAAPW